MNSIFSDKYRGILSGCHGFFISKESVKGLFLHRIFFVLSLEHRQGNYSGKKKVIERR